MIPPQIDFPKLTVKDADGNEDTIDITSTNENGEVLTSKDSKAYEKPETGAKFIADTGELILLMKLMKILRVQKASM